METLNYNNKLNITVFKSNKNLYENLHHLTAQHFVSLNLLNKLVLLISVSIKMQTHSIEA